MTDDQIQTDSVKRVAHSILSWQHYTKFYQIIIKLLDNRQLLMVSIEE